MDTLTQQRGRGIRIQGAASGGRSQSKNRKWVAGHDVNHGSNQERREHDGRRRKHAGRGRDAGQLSTHLSVPGALEDGLSGTDDDHSVEDDALTDAEEPAEAEPELETPQDRERFWQELVKAREIERKTAIAEGKMDDPTVSKRLDEAITMVGTCMDMCPRFERYRRERENNLDKWEVIPGTKRVDHKRAVKIYERAAGDKTLPSDLRPPPVLKKTLDYLFHDLVMRGGFTQTYTFIRDRSRAVRSDFTMQHEHGPLAIECHDRCARFHILALHLERHNTGFSVALEEQQLMNTLQSLKEFYEDQRGKYQAPTELEMRVYHRLIHIRDQRERREDIPEEITSHPVFQYTTQFRQHVQAKSAPITKTSSLVVDAEGMQIFARLAAVLREQGNVVMIYLVACILERLFGEDTIDDIEAIRGDLTIPEVIDGISRPSGGVQGFSNGQVSTTFVSNEAPTVRPSSALMPSTSAPAPPAFASAPVSSSSFGAVTQTSSAFNTSPAATAPAPPARPVASAFGNLTTAPNPFGSNSVFGSSSTGSISGNNSSGGVKSVFGPPPTTPPTNIATTSQSAPSIFGSSSFGPVASSSFPTSLSTVPADKPPAPIFGITDNGSSPSPGSFLSQTPPLNPLATPFAPVKVPSLFTSPIKATTSPMTATTATRPPNGGPFESTTQPSSAVPAQTSQGIFTTTSQFPSVTPTPTPQTQDAPRKMEEVNPSTPKMLERRQTLWDIPGSASPQPQTPPQEPLRISTSTVATSGTLGAPVTPVAPPPLGKLPPLPLPPTPTARWFDPGSQNGASGSSVTKKKSLLHFPTLQMPASTSADMLSPLNLHPPAGSKLFPIPNGSPSPQSRISSSPTSLLSPNYESKSAPTVEMNGHISPKGKGKEVVPDLNTRLSEYLKTSPLVKMSFKRWVDKTTDRAAWLEAYERSVAYKGKVQRERMSTSFSTGSIPNKPSQEQNKRRRVSAMEPMRYRRTRRKVALQPTDDTDLARRLKENHEDHRRRWAHGTFLHSVRTRVKRLSAGGQPSSEWRLWLSLNPENDGTAIWLEHKFDIPASGSWDSESVFSIPASSSASPSLRGSPGLIIFERIPLDGITDEIERKYRVLDDCARLRDIVQSLPTASERRFVPSLLVLQWSEGSDIQTAPDFISMTSKLVADGILKDVSTFAGSSMGSNLDEKFVELLDTVSLDVEDRLLLSTTWKDLSNKFLTPFATMLSDWLDRCWIDETLDGRYLDQTLEAMHDLQNVLARSLLRVLGISDAKVEVPLELETPAQLSKGYVMGPFLDAQVKLPVSIVEHRLSARASSTFVLPKAKLEAVMTEFEHSLEAQDASLREALLSTPLHSPPKRRVMDDDDFTDRLPSSHSHKRMRSSSISSIDGATGGLPNGVSVSPPPSTSASTAGAVDNAESPYVTVAMLRSLTRDVLKTYGRSQK